MKKNDRLVLLGIAMSLVVAVPLAHAGERPLHFAQADTAVDAKDKAAKPAAKATPMTEFATPPVPDFMLRKPSQPLTVEEMQRQANEASEKARREREMRTAPADAPK